MLSKLYNFLPEVTKGRLDFYRFPDRRQSWGGPFNGQAGRQAIFRAVISTISPGLILETGTYHGTTTELMAQLDVSVVTIENNARKYGFACERLRRFRNVKLRFGDSRSGVSRAIEEHRIVLKARPLFAYLDAHWNEDLPLAEEVEIIFSACPNAAVMIDDFRVPDDTGYGYDDYGPGRVLDCQYLDSTATRHGLVTLYPALPSAQETGSRRGCVVLAKATLWEKPLLATCLLRNLQT